MSPVRPFCTESVTGFLVVNSLQESYWRSKPRFVSVCGESLFFCFFFGGRVPNYIVRLGDNLHRYYIVCMIITQ